MSTRRRNANGAPPGPSEKVSNSEAVPAIKDRDGREKENGMSVSQLAPAVLDIYYAISMVIGGCCSNVVAYEQLLIMNPHIGSALTFSQMLFIALHSLPSFVVFSKASIFPRLKPRQVPITRWALQVMVVTSGSLLNNWAFAYNVPLTILIVFRSAGLPISMLFGYLFLNKRYSLQQVLSVLTVTAGVIMVTLSRTSSNSDGEASKLMSPAELQKYFTGIGMMTASLLCTGVLGLLQERTYKLYGPCWREGVFYTHFLSLPIFLFLTGDIKQGLSSLVSAESSSRTWKSLGILFANLLAQLFCVSGVNRLSSQVSSVSTNIALTARKAISLCFSVWWFGNEWNAQLGFGAFMVFFGSLLYTMSADSKRDKAD